VKVIEIFAKNEATDDMCAFIMRLLRHCDNSGDLLLIFKHFFKDESESASPASELESQSNATRTTKQNSLNMSDGEILEQLESFRSAAYAGGLAEGENTFDFLDPKLRVKGMDPNLDLLAF
jgi:hypothetical protein